jgi:hypothetical protein
MSDFNVRSDSVNVEQIMRQIRARIREKRGADYTEAEVQQLAKVKLEKFLDPRGVRSDLVEQFRRREYTPSPPFTKLDLTEFSIFGTHRGLLRRIRQLLQPVLKLFFNPSALVHFVWTQFQTQNEINREIEQWLRRRDPLYYELLHNLVVELTRTGIEVHNLKMRVESLSSRLDFDERRGRSLERVVEYRAGAMSRPAQPDAREQAGEPGDQPASVGPPDGPRAEGGGSERRRRRRRRRRRPGQTLAEQVPGTTGTTGTTGAFGDESQGEAPDRGEAADDFDDEAGDRE